MARGAAPGVALQPGLGRPGVPPRTAAGRPALPGAAARALFTPARVPRRKAGQHDRVGRPGRPAPGPARLQPLRRHARAHARDVRGPRRARGRPPGCRDAGLHVRHHPVLLHGDGAGLRQAGARPGPPQPGRRGLRGRRPPAPGVGLVRGTLPSADAPRVDGRRAGAALQRSLRDRLRARGGAHVRLDAPHALPGNGPPLGCSLAQPAHAGLGAGLPRTGAVGGHERVRRARDDPALRTLRRPVPGRRGGRGRPATGSPGRRRAQAGRLRADRRQVAGAMLPRVPDPRHGPPAPAPLPADLGAAAGDRSPPPGRVRLAPAALRVRIREAADRPAAGGRRPAPALGTARPSARNRTVLGGRAGGVRADDAGGYSCTRCPILGSSMLRDAG